MITIVDTTQPFLSQVSERVDALKQLGQTVENDLRSLYAYFGEAFDTSESPKPEDFFGMICSFSLSLQVSRRSAAIINFLQHNLSRKPPWRCMILCPSKPSQQLFPWRKRG